MQALQNGNILKKIQKSFSKIFQRSSKNVASEKFTQKILIISQITLVYVISLMLCKHTYTGTMEMRSHMKSLRKCFTKLSEMVSRHDERLTHDQWFEYAASSSPSAIGIMTKLSVC